MSQQALDGIRILDFSRVLAGPLCTMTLADMGADVIKVEHPQRGDDTRQWYPPDVGGMSAYFASVNRNKQSMTLDLKHPEGQAIARQLARISHIVVENFKVGQMARFGLDYESLAAINPGLVYCSITGFGQTGAYRERAGYDYVVQGMSGLMSITGEVDGEPIKVGVAISDVIAGLYATSAILAALRHAERTGDGQHVDIALLDTQIAALVNIASNYLVSGDTPPRYGNQHQNIVPYQTFKARDGAFVLAVGNDRQFKLLCHLIQRPQLAEDTRFTTNPARVAHRATLIPILAQAFAERTVADWVELLTEAGIPAGAINTVAQALNTPQVQDRHLVQAVELETGDSLQLVGSPLKLSQTPPRKPSAPPRLGQHTDAILSALLGLSVQAIDDLRQAQVIA